MEKEEVVWARYASLGSVHLADFSVCMFSDMDNKLLWLESKKFLRWMCAMSPKLAEKITFP